MANRKPGIREPGSAGWEQKAASELCALMKREFGLSPGGAEAVLRGALLTIYLTQALTPLGRILAGSAEGVEALETVYLLLHEIHRARMEALISRIAGAEAGQSRLELDCERGDIRVSFCFLDAEPDVQ